MSCLRRQPVYALTDTQQEPTTMARLRKTKLHTSKAKQLHQVATSKEPTTALYHKDFGLGSSSHSIVYQNTAAAFSLITFDPPSLMLLVFRTLIEATLH